MEQENSMNPMEENKLPTTLNVLTILTFIGCAIGLISGIWTFLGAEKQIANYEKALAKIDSSTPDFVKGMMNEETLELMRIQAANKVPMMVFGLISVILCLMGALQMRQRKMQGYYLWLVGEILPIIATVIFIGFAVFKGFAMLGLLIPLIFIILYTIQRKHLTN